MTKAMAILVGGGSGDPQLITVAGAGWLARADVVVYDRLVPLALLDLAPATAQRIYVGKSADHHAMTQEQINQLLVDLVRDGKLVVRLKGGDPFIFGRGSEEADALRQAGLAFRVVPGVTAGMAGGAYAGIPLTDRRYASCVALVTGHEDPSKDETSLDWAALAGIDTLVFYMGVGNLGMIAERLMAAGREADTPAAVIANATTPHQKVLTATLGTIAQEARLAAIEPPAITIVGDVILLRDDIAWFDRLPLFGQTVLVTRTRKQASVLSAALAEQGAEVIECPTIEILPADDYAPADEALADLRTYEMLVLTSPNGVEHLFARLDAMELDSRALAGVSVAAIGPATRDALAVRGVRADVVPEAYTTESLGKALLRALGDNARGAKVLLARADIATEPLAAAMRHAGVDVTEVTLYKTACPDSLPQPALDALAQGRVSWITFTSSSTADNFLALLHRHRTAGTAVDLAQARLASIGPVTTTTLRGHHLHVHVEAKPHTIEGLVDAMVNAREADGTD